MHAHHVATPAAVADLKTPKPWGPCGVVGGPISWAATRLAGALAFSVESRDIAGGRRWWSLRQVFVKRFTT